MRSSANQIMIWFRRPPITSKHNSRHKMECFKNTLANMAFMVVILTSMGVVSSCSKEADLRDVHEPPTQAPQLNPKSGAYALFQVSNYQGLGFTQYQLGFTVYKKGASSCPYGCVQNPPIEQTPVYGFVQTTSGNGAVLVHGYCNPTNGECSLEKGSSASSLGPKYKIISNRPFPKNVKPAGLVLQCKGVYIPMANVGSYFTYDIVNNTWTSGNSASDYFVWSIENELAYCPY